MSNLLIITGCTSATQPTTQPGWRTESHPRLTRNGNVGHPARAGQPQPRGRAPALPGPVRAWSPQFSGRPGSPHRRCHQIHSLRNNCTGRLGVTCESHINWDKSYETTHKKKPRAIDVMVKRKVMRLYLLAIRLSPTLLASAVCMLRKTAQSPTGQKHNNALSHAEQQ